MTTHRISAEHRLESIRQKLEKTSNVTIPELADEFAVSEMTIRRDLEKLEQNDEVRRVHGGAVIAERRAFEFDFKGKRHSEIEAKSAIAKEAAKLVQNGQRLILDNGTTTLQLAVELKSFERLTIITTSLAVASELQFSGLEVILTGGILREGSPHLTGMLSQHTLDILHADILFQGADAIDERGGLYNEDLMMAQVDQKMREQSDCTCVMADVTKLSKTALIRNGSLNDIDYLITDSRLPKSVHKKFSKLKAEVIKAELK